MSTTTAPSARHHSLPEASEDVLAAVAEACATSGRAPITDVVACCPTQTRSDIEQRLGGLDARGLVSLRSTTVSLTAAGTTACHHLYS